MTDTIVDGVHALDFVIPRGATGADGPAGPEGPVGPAGPTGAAESIAVRSTTTGQSGEEASVTETVQDGIHYLDFVIPRGETGPAGGELPVVTAYSLITARTTIPAGTTQMVPLQIIRSHNVSDGGNRLIVNEAGTYMVSFGLYSSSGNGSFSIASDTERNVYPIETGGLSSMIMIKLLNAGESIYAEVEAGASDVVLGSPNGADGYLTITRIGPRI